MSAIPTVLAVSSRAHETDCVARVQRVVESRGGRFLFIDSSDFPAQLRLALDPIACVEPGRIGDVEFDRVDALWIRHLDVGASLPSAMRDDHRRAARLESSVALRAALACLSQGRGAGFITVDPPALQASAPDKPAQLALARAAGFEVPRTLLSNDPDAVRAFARTLPGGMVCKMNSSAVSAVSSHDQPGGPIPTTEVTTEDLDALDGLHLSPMIFQERVDKRREWRVTAVGRRLFSACLDPSGSEPGRVDWREDGALADRFEPGGLPGAVEDATQRLLDVLGLEFAALDILETPDDRHVFLEANPIAYFGWLERATGLPIASALADLLLTGAYRRRR